MEQIALTARYDAAAPWWQGRIHALGYPAAYRRFFAAHPAPDPGHVADIGCGCGDMAAAFLAAGHVPRSLTIADPSHEMLDRAALRFPGPTESIAQPLEHLNPAHPFDTLLAGHLIEHCADPAQAFRQLAAHLLPGGRLYLVASRPHWCQWLIRLRWNHRWYASGRITAWAASAGLILQTLYRFPAGPPSRTSLGFIFHKPL
ncbi:bifunctional 2-polyprenyl-6-hydroxyphenol methylase/3-demethylubiquinol 3-O-methyltransferase UbiG [Pseudoruegeria sp. HB172150]|uniref:class I SAM-dependent methyltransferase n=1 Tax=Pseudoruegeria sp. HB172150 TaxID=2721164 RepID=UPI0015532AFE|nr:methyltransferase domain-containing protein [Pseudoruegeria sp. HB172150]